MAVVSVAEVVVSCFASVVVVSVAEVEVSCFAFVAVVSVAEVVVSCFALVVVVSVAEVVVSCFALVVVVSVAEVVVSCFAFVVVVSVTVVVVSFAVLVVVDSVTVVVDSAEVLVVLDVVVSQGIDSPEAYGFTWDSLAIRGTHADEVKLELTDSGFVLEASDLSRITAIAESNMEENGLIFSAPVQKALIYEKEDASIGVSFDLDNDGTYETPLGAVPPEITETVGSGDVDGSGEVNILDVIAVNKYILGVKELTAEQLRTADVDGNGEVNSTDSLLILKYALDMISAFPKK